MAGNDLGQHFLLHKSPRPVARRALIVGKKIFNPIVIQRGHAVAFLTLCNVRLIHFDSLPNERIRLQAFLTELAPLRDC